MVEAKRELDAAQERSDEVGRHIAGNGGALPPSELGELYAEVARLADELGEALEDLQQLGVLVKDLDAGLVDFPSERDGEPVLLCWLLGEDEVAWFHGYDDGYAGRRPL